MKNNIFTSTKNWKFTNNDEKAQIRFKLIEQSIRQQIPDNFYYRPLVHHSWIKNTAIYPLMKSIPKGVMHHNHYFCNDDQQFYSKYIIDDRRIYLTADMKGIQIGTQQQGRLNNWISMREGIDRYGREQWLRILVDLTAFTRDEMYTLNYKSKQTWNIFERKIRAPLKILLAKDIFQKYSRHYFMKYVKNGYDRIQIRVLYEKLKQYDEDGNFVRQYQIKQFIDRLDNIIANINQQYSNFSVGFIPVGFKVLSRQKNKQIIQTVCQLNWDKTVGFDFVQEQDKYCSLDAYDPIINQIFIQYPHLCHLKKVYHAGQTNNHLSHNIDTAVRAGTVRIGHGINIIQRIQFLPHCKNICFEKNPISNLLLGYKSDLREASAPILLSLGYPVSISPDDPGKFGYEDTTLDYIVCALSYNWSLRHLKLIGYHSINHAICDEPMKSNLIKSFEISWDKWVINFLQDEHLSQVAVQYHYEDIFTFCNNWSFSREQQNRNMGFSKLVDEVISDLPEDIYQNNFINYKQKIGCSKLFELLKLMPKGTLQGSHFIAHHDTQFIRQCIIPHHDIYLNDYNKQLRISTPNQGQLHGWISLDRLKLSYENEDELSCYIYGLASFSEKQLQISIGYQKQFWLFFNKKIQNILNLLGSEDIFRKYTYYIFKKLVGLNYQRAQFRIQPIKLISYSKTGQICRQYDYDRMLQIIDEEYDKIVEQYPSFSVGFIIMGNKSLSREDNFKILDYFGQNRWNKLIGFDFEQKLQDSYQKLSHYNSIVDEVLIKYDDLDCYKFYQAGNTSDHLSRNIQIAIQANSRRIANGLNILQNIDQLSKCKNICFQINPILNASQGTSKRTDFRLSVAPILLGLGYSVTINSDYSGILGFQNTIYDLFMSIISYHWSLKHLKLVILHSINHSSLTSGSRRLLLLQFEQKWQQWINK